jgi:serine/threonine protein kinase
VGPPAPLAPGSGSGPESSSVAGLLTGSTRTHGPSGTFRHYAESVARIGIQAAEALHYAHGQRILHRDVKPSNLLLDLQGTVWITDFGLAKAADEENLTHTGDLLGTLRYMAPERFQGRSDVRSDIYALGLTLYEMLALRAAFEGSDRNSLIHKVTSESPPPLRKLDPRVPRDLETIVAKAIDREPARRYQMAGEMAEDLRRFLQDKPIRARRVRLPEQAWRWSRRNPALAGMTAALLLLLVVVAAGSSGAAFRFKNLARSEGIARAEAETNSRKAEQQRREAVLSRQQAESARKQEAAQRHRAEQARAEAQANLLEAQRQGRRAPA